MNMVRQNWMSFKSPRSSMVLSAGNSTWYDVPAPVIVHSRRFHEDVNNTKDHDEVDREIDEVDHHQPRVVEEEEALYQNNVEAKLNTLNKVALRRHEVDEDHRNHQDSNGKKRHSTSIELTATTSVKTDVDGIPTITFSFFRNDEKSALEQQDIISTTKSIGNDELDGITSSSSLTTNNNTTTTTTTALIIDDQLYDFPRSGAPLESTVVVQSSTLAIAAAAVLDATTTPTQSEVVAEEEQQQQQQQSHESSLNRDVVDCYSLASSSQHNSPPPPQQHLVVDSSCSEGKGRSRIGGSGRSLVWRRSLGKIEDLVKPTHSGSYSDSEAPSLTSSGGRRWTGKRNLGRAWGRMRDWLNDERSRISEVVARHARLQAVGARLDDVTEEMSGEAGLNGSNTRTSASYDLTRARLENDATLMPRVEEFGMARLVAATHVDEIDCVDGGNDAEVSRVMHQRSHHLAIKKTASSDDILADEVVRDKPPATSFSLERLCSEDEDDDEAKIEANNAGVNGGNGLRREQQQRRRGRSGLIKRRMLGSIRGLIASTHLLHENDEV